MFRCRDATESTVVVSDTKRKLIEPRQHVHIDKDPDGTTAGNASWVPLSFYDSIHLLRPKSKQGSRKSRYI